MDLYFCIVKKEYSGESPPVCLFARFHDLPAALANAWSRHGVDIYPPLAFWSNVGSAAVHPVREDLAAHFTNSDFFLAATAFLVWQNLISS
jgi:hypothetical protein